MTKAALTKTCLEFRNERRTLLDFGQILRFCLGFLSIFFYVFAAPPQSYIKSSGANYALPCYSESLAIPNVSKYSYVAFDSTQLFIDYLRRKPSFNRLQTIVLLLIINNDKGILGGIFGGTLGGTFGGIFGWKYKDYFGGSSANVIDYTDASEANIALYVLARGTPSEPSDYVSYDDEILVKYGYKTGDVNFSPPDIDQFITFFNDPKYNKIQKIAIAYALGFDLQDSSYIGNTPGKTMIDSGRILMAECADNTSTGGFKTYVFDPNRVKTQPPVRSFGLKCVNGRFVFAAQLADSSAMPPFCDEKCNIKFLETLSYIIPDGPDYDSKYTMAPGETTSISCPTGQTAANGTSFDITCGTNGLLNSRSPACFLIKNSCTFNGKIFREGANLNCNSQDTLILVTCQAGQWQDQNFFNANSSTCKETIADVDFQYQNLTAISINNAPTLLTIKQIEDFCKTHPADPDCRSKYKQCSHAGTMYDFGTEITLNCPSYRNSNITFQCSNSWTFVKFVTQNDSTAVYASYDTCKPEDSTLLSVMQPSSPCSYDTINSSGSTVTTSYQPDTKIVLKCPGYSNSEIIFQCNSGSWNFTKFSVNNNVADTNPTYALCAPAGNSTLINQVTSQQSGAVQTFQDLQTQKWKQYNNGLVSAPQ